ncbi:MAG: recombinase family protein [Gaiellaceae bacterium]
MKLVGYVRVSRVGGREGDSFISPTVQREQIEALARARGHEIVEVIEDLDESGGKWERPGLQRALEMVESGHADGIAVAKLDRFARSVVDGLRGIERITAAGGEFVSVAESFDTTTPMGKAMLQISLVFAELERERQKAGFRVSTTHAVESGIHISTLVPTGYRRGPDRRLVLDAEAAPVIHEIFIRRAKGASWTALARYLDEQLLRPNGGTWARTTVTKMIRNRAYLGEAHQGAIVKKRAHPPIVTRAEFEAAQPRAGEPARRSGSLLVGLLACGSCGRPLHRATSADYGCRARRSDGVCPAPVTIKIARADDFVERALLDWFEQHSLVVTKTEIGATAAADLTTALEAVEAELEAYRDESLVSVIGRAAFEAGLRARQAAVDEARDILRRANPKPTVSDSYELVERWPSLSVTEKREWIQGLIEHVEVSPGRSVTPRMRIAWKPIIAEIAELEAALVEAEAAAHDAR